jgi:hypothetical protein
MRLRTDRQRLDGAEPYGTGGELRWPSRSATVVAPSSDAHRDERTIRALVLLHRTRLFRQETSGVSACVAVRSRQQFADFTTDLTGLR